MKEHLFGFRIGLEGLVSFECQNGYRGAFWQLGIEFDATINDLPNGSHRLQSFARTNASIAGCDGTVHGDSPTHPLLDAVRKSLGITGDGNPFAARQRSSGFVEDGPDFKPSALALYLSSGC